MTNLLSRFLKSFESKTKNAYVVPTTKKDEITNDLSWSELRSKIDNTRRYVPWQMWAEQNHNNQPENPQTGRIWEIIGDRLKTSYDCECSFEEGLDSYSFSGHWCELHAKFHSYQQPIPEGGIDGRITKDGIER